MKKSQKQRVIDQLIETGSVSRNWALGQRITRLAAIIPTLKGWELVGEERGGDYIYRVASKPAAPPPKPHYEFREVERDGMVVRVAVRVS